MSHAVSPPTDTTALSHGQILEILSGLLMGMFVAILSSTVVSNALPIIVPDLGGGQSGYTWVVIAALLATTASTPIWSKLADIFNKKVLVQTALIIFAVSSIIAGLSVNMEMLITMRVFQGIGGGGLIALVQVVIAYLVPPRERGRYSGYIGATFATATVGGPLIGGVLVEHLSWHYVFFVGVPFALIAFVMLQKTLHLPVVKREVHIDYWGAFLITGGVSLLLVWVSLAGQNHPWLSWQTAVLVPAAIVVLGLAVLAETKAKEPIIPPSLLRIRTVALSVIASLFVGVAMFGATIFLSQYFQLGRGESPTVAGVMTIPMILGLAIASTVTGRLITKTGKWKKFLVTGAFLIVVGFGLMGTISSATAYWELAIFMAIMGVGVGMTMQNLVLASQNQVPQTMLGAASGSVAFFRSLGGAIGVAALGAVLATQVKDFLFVNLPGSGATPEDIALLTSGRTPQLDLLSLPARTVVETAYGDAVATIFLVAAAVAVFAFVAVLFIKEVPLRASNEPVENGNNGTRSAVV